MESSSLYREPPSDPPRPSDGSWLRTAVGAFLVLVGVEIILERLIGRELHLIWPALGIVLLAAWFRHDRFPFLVAGSILTGWGLGGTVSGLLGAPFGFVSPLGLAWGLWLIQQLSGRRIGWVRVWMFIALTIALIDFAGSIGVGRALGTAFGDAAAPLAVMTIGLLILFRRRVTPPMFVVGVILAAALGVSALGGAVTGGLSGIGEGFGPRRSYDVKVGELNGRTLVIEGGSADVMLTNGDELEVTALVRGGHERPVDVARSDSEVVVRRNSGGAPGSWWFGTDYRITVPADTDIRIELGAGDVAGTVQAHNVEIETTVGDVSLSVVGDPDVSVTTRHGDIDADGFGLDDDDIDADEWQHDGEDEGRSLSITTTLGDVALEREAQR